MEQCAIACELVRYNIDIAALSESRLPEEGFLVEVGIDYSFFWNGLHKDARCIHGDEFAVMTVLLRNNHESTFAIDERFKALWRPPAKKSLYHLCGCLRT